MKHRAISYTRFSTPAQLVGNSTERQLLMFHEWLERNRDRYYESSLKYTDKGLSAFKSKHRKADLGRFLEAVESGLVSEGDCLVIEAFDRLSREDTSTALNTINNILRSGISICTLEDECIYTKSELDTAKIFQLITKVQASHEFSLRLSRRIISAWSTNESKLRKGEFAHAPNRPYWIGDDYKLKNPESEMIRHAISLYKQRIGWTEIQIALTKDFPGSAPKSTRSLKRWFLSEGIVGKWRGVNAFEPLISIEEHMELKSLIAQRAKYGKPPTRFNLTGLIKCPVCNNNFSFRVRPPNPTLDAPLGSDAYKRKPNINFGNCLKSLRSKDCSNKLQVSYEVIEFVFNQTVGETAYDLASQRAYTVIRRETHGKAITLLDKAKESEERYRNLYLVSGLKSDLDRYKYFSDESRRLKSEIDQVNMRDSDQMTLNEKIYTSDEEMLAPSIEQQRLISQVQKEALNIDSDPIKFRDDLKEHNFYIYASKEKIWCNKFPELAFTIIKRSKRMKAFIVIDNYNNTYYKIGRNEEGLLTSAALSINELDSIGLSKI